MIFFHLNLLGGKDRLSHFPVLLSLLSTWEEIYLIGRPIGGVPSSSSTNVP